MAPALSPFNPSAMPVSTEARYAFRRCLIPSFVARRSVAPARAISASIAASAFRLSSWNWRLCWAWASGSAAMMMFLSRIAL